MTSASWENGSRSSVMIVSERMSMKVDAFSRAEVNYCLTTNSAYVMTVVTTYE